MSSEIKNAHDLIDSIFRWPQEGVACNMRRISAGQLKYLRDLIDADPEGAAVAKGAPGSLIWMPSGSNKYVITEDPTGGKKHTLTELSSVAPSESGRLF
jgi:hypothetical protein